MQKQILTVMDNLFDPNGIGISNGNYFGLPVSCEDARIVLLSVPWDVTTSYGSGASKAPDAMIDASLQIDLWDHHNHEGWKEGIGTLPIDEDMLLESRHLRNEAERVIWHLENGGSTSDEYAQRKLRKINEASVKVNKYVYEQANEWLDKGKIVGLVGGDHSTPFGLIQALAERNPGMGILQIDAHADLRECYEGFEYSHASIMYNSLTKFEGVGRLVQVATRDLCDEEVKMANDDPRIFQFDDYTLKANSFEGMTWNEQCQQIIDKLPEKVYVSFDIDGLSPDNCPSTGTPVPGGLSFHEAVYLIDAISRSGRTIIGFDLNEVVPSKHNQWDANVGARMLYKLCNITLK